MMNRRDFLKTSGALLPVSLLGLPTGALAMAPQAKTAPAGKESYEAARGRLKFNPDGSFKIVQFTDTHWVPGNDASAEATERMNEVLDAERPDFVIYTGDIVFGSPAREGFERCLAPVVERGTPFAVTLGNHDDEHDMTRRQIFDYLETLPGNLTGTVPGISGVTNFALPVMGSGGSGEAAFVLWGFDSLAYSERPETKGYDWIKHDQIDWYRRLSAHLTAENGGVPIPALAFFHIPLPEFNEAASTESAKFTGTRGEKACAPVVNSGLFTAMLEAGDVRGVFVGHDHVNDYVVDWRGIKLGYGRFTGGKTVYHDIPGGNGARVFVLREGSRSFKTWIRLKNGEVISLST